LSKPAKPPARGAGIFAGLIIFQRGNSRIIRNGFQGENFFRRGGFANRMKEISRFRKMPRGIFSGARALAHKLLPDATRDG
jgi:hypothetical protein